MHWGDAALNTSYNSFYLSHSHNNSIKAAAHICAFCERKQYYSRTNKSFYKLFSKYLLHVLVLVYIVWFIYLENWHECSGKLLIIVVVDFVVYIFTRFIRPFWGVGCHQNNFLIRIHKAYRYIKLNILL